ncbi:hypothetical protein [Tychonema sp. BBK16]|uniref:hypothetical protein n=1 Tax=Tychonema sp. BBK16 TaxID=2699888 RepID=UPI0038D2659A
MANVQMIGNAGVGHSGAVGEPAALEAFPHWQYFLSIESDFEKSLAFVELTQENFNTFSTEYVRILLSACSEVDVVMKQICLSLQPTARLRNIDDYREIIKSEFPHFARMKVFVPRYGRTLEPWIDWEQNANPKWWRAHTNVKHERNLFYSSANLDATLNSVAGLFCTVLYFNRQVKWSSIPGHP